MITFEKFNLIPSYCVFNGIKNIDLNLLNINKKCIKNTDVLTHEIKYIDTKNIDNQNIDNELPLRIIFSDVNAHIIEENENKYLIFASTKNNRKMFEMYKNVWSKIKTQSGSNSIETINSSKCNLIESIKDEKNPMKIRFDSFYDNDDLPLDKVL